MYTVITLKNASKHGHYPIFKKYIHAYMYLHTLFTGSQEDHEVIHIYIYIYLCDFAKSCLLSFRLNTGIARVQASVVRKEPGGLVSC